MDDEILSKEFSDYNDFIDFITPIGEKLIEEYRNNNNNIDTLHKIYFYSKIRESVQEKQQGLQNKFSLKSLDITLPNDPTTDDLTRLIGKLNKKEIHYTELDGEWLWNKLPIKDNPLFKHFFTDTYKKEIEENDPIPYLFIYEKNTFPGIMFNTQIQLLSNHNDLPAFLVRQTDEKGNWDNETYVSSTDKKKVYELVKHQVNKGGKRRNKKTKKQKNKKTKKQKNKKTKKQKKRRTKKRL
jgi:hypothetical protein